MATCHCPNCGHAFTPEPKAKRSTTIVNTMLDTSAMSTPEMYAYYKKTSPIADCRFFEAAMARQLGTEHPLYDAARALAIDAPTLNRAETFRRLTALQDQWRRTSNPRVDRMFAAERAAVQRRIVGQNYRKRVHQVQVTIAKAAQAEWEISVDGYHRPSADDAVSAVRSLVQYARQFAPGRIPPAQPAASEAA